MHERDVFLQAPPLTDMGARLIVDRRLEDRFPPLD